ncbi:TetR/AcrR family transcriptional regulator [Mycobacterium crocinum]|uniref:TetR/AcrR family transcriptional regulator n=1 Tax=Mycolicibacterium crocinum TaxID=388459 RepID=A0ABY3TEX5_9MYCO|nr:TetR/AcrR family transcriptional regulator [Mycolicibacterium crocinum]MCV7215435.1 TetR/AcrR family transcriptional regulator [Mycolicibacterium crocinum]ULN39944.1 TetR/AcrR family transcriptional regulator [Mycolicibacterium crocinum]
MRRHGWAGDIPVDDEEAIRRIVEVARASIDATGTVTVSDVATKLGITRQTVYRYFPTLDALLAGTAMSAVGGFLDRLARDLQAITDPTTAVVEGIAYTLEQLPADRYLSLVMEPGRASAFAAGVTSETAISFGRMILERFNIDWDSAGFSGRRLDELVEFMLRTVQSFILDPGGPDRHGKELRAFLRRWVAPAVEQQSTKGPSRVSGR